MGCIMGKCVNCHLSVLDESETCPLCRSILEPEGEMENMYPELRVQMHRRLLACRIWLFFVLASEAVLIAVDLNDSFPVAWSVITGLALLYSYLVLRYAVLGRSGYRAKVLVLAILAVLAAIAADFVIGYRGWSVDYVLPAGILLVDAVVLGCMIWNRRNWQSYLMWQLLMILLSAIPLTLCLLGLERRSLMAFLPAWVSCGLFLGTVIIGGPRAWTELRRRFHVN